MKNFVRAIIISVGIGAGEMLGKQLWEEVMHEKLTDILSKNRAKSSEEGA